MLEVKILAIGDIEEVDDGLVDHVGVLGYSFSHLFGVLDTKARTYPKISFLCGKLTLQHCFLTNEHFTRLYYID